MKDTRTIYFGFQGLRTVRDALQFVCNSFAKEREIYGHIGREFEKTDEEQSACELLHRIEDFMNAAFMVGKSVDLSSDECSIIGSALGACRDIAALQLYQVADTKISVKACRELRRWIIDLDDAAACLRYEQEASIERSTSQEVPHE